MRGRRAVRAAAVGLGAAWWFVACSDAEVGPGGAAGASPGGEAFGLAEADVALSLGEKPPWVNPARCYDACGTAPADLVAITSRGVADPAGAFRVRGLVQAPLAALIAESEAAGQPARIADAFRTHAQQAALFASTAEKGRAARPGHSEHELGLAADVNPASGSDEGYAWLADNAHRHGFVLSYQDGKQKITGYRPEPWHLRYVGPKLATFVHAFGLTLEEYFRLTGQGDSGDCGACPSPLAAAPCGEVSWFGGCEGTILTYCYDGVTLNEVDCAVSGDVCRPAGFFGPTCAKAPGVSTPLSPPQPGLADLAGDGASLYWVRRGSAPDYADGAVLSCPISGCPDGPTVLAAGQARPEHLSVTATHVYWANAAGGQVLRCAKAGCGGTPEVIASGQASPQGVEASSAAPGDARTFVFWTNRDAGTVVRCPAAGCGASGPDLVATGQAGPTSFTTGASNIYWLTSAGAGAFFRVPKPPVGGGPAAPVQLLSAAPSPEGLAILRSKLYAVARGSEAGGYADGSLTQVDLSGGVASPVVRVFATGLSGAFDVAALPVDGTSEEVYFNAGGQLLRCPSTGCGAGPTPVTGERVDAAPIAADATSVYFLRDGVVRRLLLTDPLRAALAQTAYCLRPTGRHPDP
jgi:D-alanyl-D-alanine carboxypeptidase-like protein